MSRFPVESNPAIEILDGYRFVPATISGGRPEPVTGSAKAARIAEWNALRDCTGLDR